MFADETQTKIVESDALLEQMEKDISSSFLSLKQKYSGKIVDQFQNKNKQKHNRNFFLHHAASPLKTMKIKHIYHCMRRFMRRFSTVLSLWKNIVNVSY